MKTEASEYLSLLQEIQNNNVSTFTVMPADEPRFTIETNSRNIIVPSEFSFLSVQNDHRAETIYFEIDRYFDNVDLSQHTCVVQFINKSGTTINEGTYPVTSMDIDSVDGKIVFGWEIRNDATQLTGDITFSVRFYSIGNNGNFTYNFNTLTASSYILPSLNIIASGERITATELEVWTDKMNNLASSIESDIITVEEKIEELENYIASIPEDYTALTEEVSQLSGDIVEVKNDLDKILSPNLYNPADAKENIAINQDDGTEMPFDGWIATGYIRVSKGDVLYFSLNGEATPYSTGAFYDKNKQRVDSFGNPNNNNNNITVTCDGYARFSFNGTREKLQIEKGARTEYIPYGELKLKLDVTKVQEEVTKVQEEVTKVQENVTEVQEDHTNLFNKDTIAKGAVLPDIGYFDTSFTNWESSDYIPVKPGMVLYFSTNQSPYGAASTGAYFDKDKKYLAPLKDEPLSITIPDDAYFIRFSKSGGFGDALSTLKVEQYGITKYTPYGEIYVILNESALPSYILPKWNNLKILTLGDSITAMGGVNGWTYWIKQYLLADKVVNVSVAGATWQDKVSDQIYDGNPQPSTDGNVMGNQVQKVLNAKVNGDVDYQDFDVITFSFGTNDSVDFSVQTKESVENQFISNYSQNQYTVVPLENVNRQTLAGAMRYGFEKLHEAYPNAVIFMCTPTQECYETFDSIYQKGELINYIANRCGCETIDTLRCGIRNIYESQTIIDYDHPEQSGTAPIQTDLIDGIHTNESGAKKIAKYNAREIMKYFMIN